MCAIQHCLMAPARVRHLLTLFTLPRCTCFSVFTSFIKGVRPSDLNSVIFQAALDMLRDDLGVAFVSLETQAEVEAEVEAKVLLSERWESFQAARYPR